MDRLMTESQKHSGGVSTLTRHKTYSQYNPGQVKNGRYTVTMDWNTACFAHLPYMLTAARKDKVDGKGVKVFRDSDITEILYLPHFASRFIKKGKGIRDSLDYLTDILQFMGVSESAASIMLEGWAFKLNRSGQWNVAVCSLIRYLSESPNRVDAYLYMRRTLKLTVPKALFICHFIERIGKRWHINLSPGGHTLLRGRGTRFSQFPTFVKWREQDKDDSILESCVYQGINVMFGNANNWKEIVGKDAVHEFVCPLHEITDNNIKAFSKLLKQPRGKKHEGTDSKPARVRKRVRPDEAPIHIEAGGDLELRSGPVYGGVRRRSVPVLSQAAPPDILDPFEGPRRARPIPRGKKA